MNKINLLAVLVAGVFAVACNGGAGGSGSSSGDMPNPTPTPIPTLEPLQITQNVVPSLNKVGSHQIWYLIVNNINNESVAINQFALDGGDNTPINPTKYAMKYNNELSNISIDCLDVINRKNTLTKTPPKLPSKQSCAYKFDAQWDKNTTLNTTFNFKFRYDMQTQTNYRIDLDNYCSLINFNTYIESSSCMNSQYMNDCYGMPGHKDEQKYFYAVCLNTNNQSLKYNLMNLKTTTSYLGDIASGWSNLFSMDGSGYWYDKQSVEYQQSSIKYSKMSYDSNLNQLRILNTKIFESENSNQFNTANWGVISQNGENYISGNYSQNGLINDNHGINRGNWIYGLDGVIYTQSNCYSQYGNDCAYFLNQSTMTVELLVTANNPVVLVSQSGWTSSILGADKAGNLWVTDDEKMYCYKKSDNYSIHIMNFNGVKWTGWGYDYNATANGYYMDFKATGKYYDLSPIVDGSPYNIIPYTTHFRIDLDKCEISVNDYLASQVYWPEAPYSSLFYRFNQQYGMILSDNATYLESYNQFSNGLNGGN